MKHAFKAAVAAAALAAATVASATPSTTYWTPATTYVQPFLVPHLTYDTYFGETGAYQIDTGITIGILPFEKVQAEVGFDLLYPGKTKAGFLLNAKLVLPEGAFGEYVPGFSLGVQNVGFEKNVSDLNLIHGSVGKTFGFGNLTLGAYYGANKKALLTTEATVPQFGGLASYTSPDINVKVTGLDKVVLIADVQTGKNNFGAYGVGAAFYFTPAIDVITGPVFFLDKGVQPGGSKMLWTVQLDVDFDLRAPAPAPAK
jgi:hypothetical protein